MNQWKKVLVSNETSIKKVLKVIDSAAAQIALVVDSNQKLLGVVTDGDVRRGILKGVGMDQPVKMIMKKNPISVTRGADQELILSKMKSKVVHQIPIIDEKGRVVGLEQIDELVWGKGVSAPVVIMAGGLGSRLKPLTNSKPKPLIEIGGKPILEMILDNLIEHQFRNFYISVNYKSEMIKRFFGNGDKWGVKIRYIHESRRMGTAGALSMLPEKPQEPFIVMNADLLTKINFRHLLDFHKEHKADITVCVREYDFQVPFGVIQTNEHLIQGIDEKPTQHFFVNAGIYVINPKLLKLLKYSCYLDMPQFIEMAKKKRRKVVAFPIHEYWLDIGHLGDLKRANDEVQSLFK